MKRLLVAVLTLVSVQALAADEYTLKYSTVDFQSVETVKALHRRIVDTARRTCPSYGSVRNLRVVRDCNVPCGALDTDPGMGPAYHIFVGSKAAWFQIHDKLPQHEATAT